jgi:hypothetical protein
MNNARDFLDSIGVNLHLQVQASPYFTAFSQVLPMLQDLGIKRVRENAYWAVSVTRDYFFYQNARQLVAGGIKFSLNCFDPLNRIIYVQPSAVRTIYDWMDGGVDLFEGSNEPSVTSAPGALPLIQKDHQTALYQNVKADPVIGALQVASPSYIQANVALINQPFDNIVDLTNIHPYPGREHPETTVAANDVRQVGATAAAKYGGKPVIATETGYHTALSTTSAFFPVNEDIKVRYLMRLLLWYFINGVQRTYIYQLIDHLPPDDTNPETKLGLVDFTLNKKASYKALRELMRLVKGDPTISLPPSDRTFTLSHPTAKTAMFQRADGSHLLFIWEGVDGWDQTNKVALPPTSTNATLTFDPAPTTVWARRFQDDGTLTKTIQNPVSPGVYNIIVSDQLKGFEIA